MVYTAQLIALLAIPFTVLACEGECITGITNEYINRYSSVIDNVFQTIADQIDTQLIPPDNRRQDSISYFTPVIKAYNKDVYAGLERAIFPTYFHGKCLDSNGNEPDGCPNPDCPVVCGTPGSLVHFFPILTARVFEQILGQLTNLTSPGSKVYRQIQKMVVADAQKTRRSLSRVSRFAKLEARGTAETEKRLRAIMKTFPALMYSTCGGSNLSQCTWEMYMKKFILQYP